MIINKLYTFHERMFDIIINVVFILLIITLLGLSQYAPKYLNYLDYYLKIYICLFLIWRFNPLRSKYECTDLDIKIAFNSGLVILTSTALNQYVKYFETDITKKFKNIIPNV